MMEKGIPKCETSLLKDCAACLQKLELTIFIVYLETGFSLDQLVSRRFPLLLKFSAELTLVGRAEE